MIELALPINPTEQAGAGSGPTHKRRIFLRTVWMAWLLVVFTVLIFLGITIPSQRRQLLEEMRQRAQVVYSSTAQVAVEAIVLDDFSAIVEHCVNLVAKNPGLKYVVLTRKDGFSLVHTRTRWYQDQLNGVWRPGYKNRDVVGRFMVDELSEDKVYHLSYPLTYSGIDWGWIHLGLSPEKFNRDLHALYSRSFVAALLAVAGGLIASFLYARRLSVPIQRLDRFAREIAAGDLSRHIDIRTQDEVQSLADSFNHMVTELNRSNRKLVKTAHQAGMAEMAVGVLHNVGNVLNSVGVTTQMLKRRVGQSRMATLQPMIDLMESQKEHLADFIANDPKGQKLPLYLSALGAHLQKDHQAITAGLDDLERHIQHIQDIVRLQQNYSRPIGLTERVTLVEVIDDAVALNLDGIKQFDIRVNRRLDPMDPVVLDRQKLLQILTNLIGNARQALQACDTDPKQIDIQVYTTQAGTLCIVVSDNGMGIAAQNLTRIFQHGFTTRSDGHGFGLHSSALAASEMNGTLQAESPGPGRGATFTLELPIRTMENTNELKQKAD